MAVAAQPTNAQIEAQMRQAIFAVGIERLQPLPPQSFNPANQTRQDVLPTPSQ